MFRIFYDQADNGSGGSNESTVTETTVAETTPAQETVAPEQADVSAAASTEETPAAEGGEAAADGAEGAAAPETPVYTPDFKYRGAEQDKEVPEFLRGIIKDAETEKQVKSLLAKADGLDLVKTRSEEIRKERDVHKTNFSSLADQINDAKTTYQRGDIDTFLKKLDIPEERMLQWAIDKVKYSQLPPEQKRLVDDQWAAKRQAWDLEKSNQSLSQSNMQQEAKNLQTSFDYELMKPEVSEFVKSFDGAVGKPGAFLEEVRNRGELAFTRSGGKTIRPVNEVIQEVMQAYGSIAKRQAPANTTQQAAPGTMQAKPAPKAAPSTIPNVSGKSSSPLKTGPRSIDDLRKIAQDLNG